MTQLITPRKSWAEKVRDGVKESSPQVKQGLIAAASLFVVTIIGTIGGCWKVSVENTALRAKLSATNDLMHVQETQLATLRHDNENLVAENNRYKVVMNPIERRAKELYPELETSAAVAKLAKDLEDVRNLATRTQFQPIASETRKRMVSDLGRIQAEFAAEKILIDISALVGNTARRKLAEELADILKESGLPVNLGGTASYQPETFDTPVRVFISSHGSVKLGKLFDETVKGISPLLTSGLVPIWNVNTTNTIVIQIMGTPAFLPNGSVVFE